PIHYFIHLKMQRACELLETTEFDVREIAELLGYADPFYFSKLFKRTIGQSPQHFRIARVT
ncbi:MAG: helix-turn-helix transcriptional regulator, partial [Spongiibacteraceae bacterium]